MTRSTVILLAAACAAAIAVPLVRGQVPQPAGSILDKAESFELFSLNPKPVPQDDKGTFHGYKILGSTVIKDAATRKKIKDAFDKGVKEHDGSVAGCFIPRHGIRATHDGKTVDLVICFQCLQVMEYLDGKQGKGFLVSRSPQPVFNAVLEAAKVPLPKD
jgi:hypothetical protein